MKGPANISAMATPPGLSNRLGYSTAHHQSPTHLPFTITESGNDLRKLDLPCFTPPKIIAISNQIRLNPTESN